MNQLGIALVWCALQVSLLSLIAVALYASARRWGPTARSHIAFAGMVLVLALTALAFSPWPRWQFTFRDGAPSQPAPHTAAAPEVAAHHVDRPALDANRPEPAKTEQSEQPSLASAFWTTFVQELGRPQALPERTNWRWPSIIAALFLAGIAFGTARLLAGWWAVRALRRRSKPIHDPTMLGLLDVVQAELSCRRLIELRESPSLVTAATIGWRKPLILLPAEWTDWTEAERHAVLAHEIAHIGRHDFAAWIFAECGLVLHFYHPLVHWLAGRLRLEQELAADAAAAAVTGGQRPYLTTLAAMALRQPDRPLSWPARTFLPTRRTFLRRIEMLRDSTVLNTRASAGLRFAALGLLFLAGLGVAGLRGPALQAQNEPREDQPPQNRTDRNAQPAGFELNYIPQSALGIAVARPAEIYAKLRSPQLADLMKRLELEKHAGVSVHAIDQVTVVFAREGERDPAPVGFIVRTYEPDQAERIDQNMGEGIRKQHAGTNYFTTTETHKFKWFRPDERTVVLIPRTHSFSPAEDEDATIKEFIDAARGRGAGDEWAKALDAFGGTHAALAIDVTRIQPMFEQRPPGARREPAPMAMFAPLWQHTETFALGVSLEDGVELHGTARTSGDEGAQRVSETANALLTLARNLVGQGREQIAQAPAVQRELMTQIITLGEDLLKSARVTRDDSTIHLHAQAEGDGATALIAAQVFPAVSKAREAAQRQVSTNNLKQIAIAMHNYHDAHGQFPPAVVMGPDGKTTRSWRVELLPFLEAADLYQQYRQNEPWDSEHNKKILERMPAVFRNPRMAADATNTAYFVLTGPDAMFSSEPRDIRKNEGPQIFSIRDGTSNTLMVVESKRDVPWTKPEDIAVDLEKELPELGGIYKDGWTATFADGSPRFISDGVDENVLRALITPDGRESVRPLAP